MFTIFYFENAMYINKYLKIGEEIGISLPIINEEVSSVTIDKFELDNTCSHKLEMP